MPEYKTDVSRGPTYRYVHNECGRRVSRWETTTGGYAFTCTECDETYTLRGLGSHVIDKVRVA